MRLHPIGISYALLAAASSVCATAVAIPPPNGTVELAPRATQSGISVIECTLQLSLVQCCQTFEPLSLVSSIVGPILSSLGIPLPGLGSLVAFDCHPTVLGLGCQKSTLCCTLVVPDENIGLNCEPVAPLL